ncbi:MAG TPA: cytochrome c oxidase assembly protein [Nocardioidaceae bacterium]|nr:cytochrome c oxidase assembly protein [Nocardioidaceae bacterium]
MPLPPLTWSSFWASWGFRPVWDLLILVALVCYLLGLRAAARRGTLSVHPARVASFVAGLVLLAFTLNSAIDVYAMAVFWDHMIEHLLLIMVVPALLVVGLPLTVWRDALTGRARTRLESVLESRPVAVLTHPIVGLGIYSLVIVATHLTSFMDQMAMHPWLMYVEQVLYLVAGYLFLLPLLGREPIRWRLPYLFRIALILVGMTPDTVVGIVLMQTQSDPFPMMFSMHPAWAPAPLHDLEIGGAMMWAFGDMLMMFFGFGVIAAFIADPHRDRMLGPWLERVRAGTLSANVVKGLDDSASPGFAEDADVDEDEEVLAAYNRMLGRLDSHRSG